VTREAESADWTLAGSKERPDLQKATDLASSLGWVKSRRRGRRSAKADTGSITRSSIKADTFDGLSYTLRVGKQAGDNYYSA